MGGFFDGKLIQDSLDYILIFGVMVITVYVINNMIQKNRNAKPINIPPPFVDTPDSTQRSELTSVENTSTSSGIQNLNLDSSEDNALRNFCIKSASNCAYTGGYMNLNMIKYVLSRGCRFLDMEVYLKDDIPIVAYSTNQNSIDSFTSNAPAVSLAGVFSTIMSNAFSDTSPNEKDPLFIHLRIKTRVSTAFSKIAKIIKSNLGAKLYIDGAGNAAPIDLDTQVSRFMGKIILIIDQESSPDYRNYSTCTPDTDCVSLSSLANMVSNSQNIRVYTENTLMYQPINPPDPSVYLFRIVLPSLGFFNGTQNSDSLYLVKSYGTQVVAQAFYVNDMNLRNYEEMFKSRKSAFVRISDVLKYVSG
tara:strand:- start:2862 stop:3944 length:1083 start_codon:yes stop_codon:yes gene_type:complete